MYQTLSDSNMNKSGQTFWEWKNALDSLYLNIFHTKSYNLPDLPYYDMFIENVDENAVVLCMYRKISYDTYSKI